MLVDSRSLPKNTRIDTDVCIVGGGVAGITVAREFAGQPFRVSLLESGGMEPDSETQSLCRGQNVGIPYFQLDDARPRCLGGSAFKWFMPINQDQVGIQLRPLDTIDFEERDWIPYSGWPFDKSHLDPFYQRAQVMCGLGPYQYGGVDWENPQQRPCLQFLNGHVKTVIFQLGARDTFMRYHREQICSAENISVYLHATVADIETNSTASAVTGLRVTTSSSKSVWVTAKVFILALGGIETPRLLLLSNGTQREGLGNANDLVGRFFMEHPHLGGGTYVTPAVDIKQFLGLYEFHKVRDVPIYGRLAVSDEVQRHEKLLNYTVAIWPKFFPLTIHACANKIRHECTLAAQAVLHARPRECAQHIGSLFPLLFSEATPAIGRKILSLMRKRFSNRLYGLKRTHLFALSHMAEQAPNPDSRVTLSEEQDHYGQRRVKLNWQLKSIDMWSILRSQEIIDQELRRAGLGQLEIELKKDGPPPPDLHGGMHHIGTTRMHTNPRKGVVTEHCQVHGIHNLFIAGPSVFPTGGYANPTLTIVALAIRLADRVKHHMANLPN